MTPDAPGSIALPADGPSAPPRANGELVFDAPWQSRAFGVAAALADAGHLAWPDLQTALIERVGRADRDGHDTGTPSGYWTCWLEALGAVTDRAGQVSADAWSGRAEAFAARPAGHDHNHHDHGHDHDHDHDHSHSHDHSHDRSHDHDHGGDPER